MYAQFKAFSERKFQTFIILINYSTATKKKKVTIAKQIAFEVENYNTYVIIKGPYCHDEDKNNTAYYTTRVHYADAYICSEFRELS